MMRNEGENPKSAGDDSLPETSTYESSEEVKQGEDNAGILDTEVAAQLSVPIDGGWAWVVLACATLSLAIIDGTAFTFGPLLPAISKELNVSEPFIAFINSVAIALYFLLSPIVSALINRFGFRAIGMTGSIITSVSLFMTYFSRDYFSIFTLYGVFNGCGLSMCGVVLSIVCGFYFERLRSIALVIVSLGTGFGVTVLYPVNVLFVDTCGWRTLVLFHAGLIGFVYFLTLTFRPLLNLTLTAEEEGRKPRTLKFLSTTSKRGSDTRDLYARRASLGTYPNVCFPTAKAAFESTANFSEASTSIYKLPNFTLRASTIIRDDQIKQMESIVLNAKNLAKSSHVNLKINIPEAKRSEYKSCCARLLDWERHTPEARPMYRDDAFYTGEIENLAVYKENVLTVDEKDRTGLEYNLAVTRVTEVDDLNEAQQGFLFTTAARRVLISMLDPTLLKRLSFVIFCSSGLLKYGGVMVPYVYTQARAVHYGLPYNHASLLVSALSISNMLGRGVASILIRMKFNTIHIMGVCSMIAGLSTMLSGISYNALYQYGYVILFGITIAPSACLRSILLVECYGLENLINATGYTFMFIGVGNIFSTPLGAVLRDMFGYECAFVFAGGLILLSGVLTLFPFRYQRWKEVSIENEAHNLSEDD